MSSPLMINMYAKVMRYHNTYLVASEAALSGGGGSGGGGENNKQQLDMRLAAIAERYNTMDKELRSLNARVARCGDGGSSSTATAAASPKMAAAAAVAKHDPKELEPCAQDTPEVAKLRAHCKNALAMRSAIFRWVPSEYYTKPLQWRRDQLKAPSIQYLCKSIVLENTHCTNEDCSVASNSRYYIAVYQYVEKFDAELIMRFVKNLNDGLGKKKFNFRLADPEKSQAMTGFGYNAVVPFGTVVPIPVILSEKITKLSPAQFWLGGGHQDCKVRVDVEEFLSIVKPLVADFTTPLTEEELSNLTE